MAKVLAAGRVRRIAPLVRPGTSFLGQTAPKYSSSEIVRMAGNRPPLQQFMSQMKRVPK